MIGKQDLPSTFGGRVTIGSEGQPETTEEETTEGQAEMKDDVGIWQKYDRHDQWAINLAPPPGKFVASVIRLDDGYAIWNPSFLHDDQRYDTLVECQCACEDRIRAWLRGVSRQLANAKTNRFMKRGS